MGISFLATSLPERAVWLSFGFYLLNLLVPIIPAVIIYRLFPEGKAGNAAGNSVEGSVAGWKIKAVGAWGAYVTAFVLGFWAIKSTAVPLIKAVGGASVWTIDSDFRFMDEKGNEIEAALTNLEVEPPMVLAWGKHATIKLFSATLDPPDTIRMKMQGYDPAVVPLNGVLAKDGKINLPTPITLKQLPPINSGPAPTPLPAQAGPPVVVPQRIRTMTPMTLRPLRPQTLINSRPPPTPSPVQAGSPVVTPENGSSSMMLRMQPPLLSAADLRGGVVSPNPNTQIAEPLAGVEVALLKVMPNGNFNLVRQTVTGPDGSYYFSRVFAGHYVLQIDGTNYPLEVRESERQDIPIITATHH